MSVDLDLFPSTKDLAIQLKDKGNGLFKEGKYVEAIAKYTEALGHDNSSPVLYSNRSLAYLKLNRYQEALADSIKCIEYDPKWIKGFVRKTKAHQGLGNHVEVMKAAEDGYKVGTDARVKRDLVDCWLLSNQTLHALPEGSIDLPRGISILSQTYMEILVCLIRSMNGECPLSYDLMEQCLLHCAQEIESILKKFGENTSPIFHEWTKFLPSEIYPYPINASTNESQLLEIKRQMEFRSDSLVTFINKEVDPAIYPVLRPLFGLVVLVVLNRCNILSNNNTSHHSMEIMNEALLPLFESSLLAHEDYHSMYVGRICSILDSFIGRVDSRSEKNLTKIKHCQVKLEKAIKSYPRHLPEFQKDRELAETILSNISQNVLQPSSFRPPCVPVGTTMTVEVAERMVNDKPDEVKVYITKHLKQLKEVEFLTMNEVEELVTMAGIFHKLGNLQESKQVFIKGEQSFFQVFGHLLSSHTLTLDQCPSAITPIRQLILNQALLFPDLFIDVTLRWKCLFKELRLQMIRRSSNSIFEPFFKWYSSQVVTTKDVEAKDFIDAVGGLVRREQKILEAEAKAVLTEQSTLTYKEVLAVLDDDVVTVDYVFIAPLYQEDTSSLDAYCVIGQKDQQPIVCRLDFPAILTHTRRLIYLLSHKSESNDFIKQVLRSLSTVLFPKSLLEILAKGVSKRVFISPDFDLSKIPLDILPVTAGTSEQPLYDLASVSFVSSMKQLISSKGNIDLEKKNSCYIIGNPNFNLQKPSSAMESLVYSFCDYLSIGHSGSKLDQLTHSQSEVNFISFCLQSSKYNAVCMIGDNATFNNVMSIQNPLLLHFSSHASSATAKSAAIRGSFFVDLDSAIVLAGYNTFSRQQFGLLPPECGPAQLPPMAIYSMELSQTKVVFLSTCNSAAGESPFLEGVSSLADAFITAGADTVIASLWTIPDQSAATFTKFFYDKLVQPGVRPSQALAYARTSFLETSEEWTCPNAFICYGMDNPLA